ncbi:ParB/RepB/Spo0J family partition protein [Nonomuraea insulae]|uniref:ParB/RepB/Spo0J family partition protein n=1 Tax=Nonomuraea insulae TaxID=1616787 RepID=A0ABW1CMD3_9ACTN
MPLSSLLPADSPRLSGEDDAHTRLLEEKVPELPPILVNRRTMQVIDGMHRLRAAKLAGLMEIQVEFVDVDQREAFLLAVKANTDHGLPLSLCDREAAAARIISWYPQWADRAIAAQVGLAPGTVTEIRRRSTDQSGHSNVRIGRDGRIRPISTAAARQQAWEILDNRPNVSLREVARMVGLSLGTVHDVRERMRQGRSPVPDRESAKLERAGGQCDSRMTPSRRRTCPGEPIGWWRIRTKLSEDPTLRYTEWGRRLLRWFDTRVPRDDEWSKIIEGIPPHWVDSIVRAAYACGDEWHEFALTLDQRRQNDLDHEDLAQGE